MKHVYTNEGKQYIALILEMNKVEDSIYFNEVTRANSEDRCYNILLTHIKVNDIWYPLAKDVKGYHIPQENLELLKEDFKEIQVLSYSIDFDFLGKTAFGFESYNRAVKISSNVSLTKDELITICVNNLMDSSVNFRKMGKFSFEESITNGHGSRLFIEKDGDSILIKDGRY